MNSTDVKNKLKEKYNITHVRDEKASFFYGEDIIFYYCDGFVVERTGGKISLNKLGHAHLRDDFILLSEINKMREGHAPSVKKIEIMLEKRFPQQPHIWEFMELAKAKAKYDSYRAKLDNIVAIEGALKKNKRARINKKNVHKLAQEKNKRGTKKIILHSTEPQVYGDIKIECEVISDIRRYVEIIIEDGYSREQIKVAQKTAEVLARKGVVGEVIDTRPRVRHNGRVYVMGETKSQVSVEGSMIVANIDGEENIVSPNEFVKRYKPANEEDILSHEKTHALFKPLGKPAQYLVVQNDIVFIAPWGTEVFALKGAALNISNLNNIYPIQNEAFDKTYKKLPSRALKKQGEEQ